MAKNRKPPLDERLSRYDLARDVSQGLSRGIDHLPVGDLTKMALKMKSGEAVAVLAETSAAVAAAATTAAREGVEAFHHARAESATPGGAKHATPGPQTAPSGAAPAAASWQTTADPGPTSPQAPPQTPAQPWASAGPDATVGPDLTARLERLRDLHTAGHLDDDEYRSAKAKLLGLD